MQQIDFYMIDAFSTTTFGGNAAAVCPLSEWLPDETLLNRHGFNRHLRVI